MSQGLFRDGCTFTASRGPVKNSKAPILMLGTNLEISLSNNNIYYMANRVFKVNINKARPSGY